MFVFKVRPGRHVNNFGMGGGGRYRTNVWDYAGVSGFRQGRADDLEMHPTVKPVAMVEDAIKDCSRRGDLVLDVFAGSGTTLIAAERSKRRARILEIDPRYCDVIISRFRKSSRGEAYLSPEHTTFDQVAATRRGRGVEA